MQLSTCLHCIILAQFLVGLAPAYVIAEPSKDQVVKDRIVITVIAGRDLTPAPDNITIDKDIRFFGREIPDQSILIDSKTRGLANVFVWTDRDALAKPEGRSVVEHYIALANGQYTPRAFVAEEGDRLRFLSVDPVPDDVRETYFPRVSGDRGPSRGAPFLLNAQTDAPRKIESSIYPWLTSWVFVQKQSQCAITDRLGECSLVTGGDQRRRLHLWHEKLQKPRIVELSGGASDEPGIVDVPPQSRIIKVTLGFEGKGE